MKACEEAFDRLIPIVEAIATMVYEVDATHNATVRLHHIYDTELYSDVSIFVVLSLYTLWEYFPEEIEAFFLPYVQDTAPCCNKKNTASGAPSVGTYQSSAKSGDAKQLIPYRESLRHITHEDSINISEMHGLRQLVSFIVRFSALVQDTAKIPTLDFHFFSEPTVALLRKLRDSSTVALNSVQGNSIVVDIYTFYTTVQCTLEALYTFLRNLLFICTEDGIVCKKNTFVRKYTGRYYTPKELAHTMSTHAVERLLRTENIDTIHIIDNACGVGNFLNATLDALVSLCDMESVQCTQLEEGIPKQKALERYFFQHSIYGVDIDAIAVMITYYTLQKRTHVIGMPLVRCKAHFRVGNALLSLQSATVAKNIVAFCNTQHINIEELLHLFSMPVTYVAGTTEDTLVVYLQMCLSRIVTNKGEVEDKLKSSLMALYTFAVLLQIYTSNTTSRTTRTMLERYIRHILLFEHKNEEGFIAYFFSLLQATDEVSLLTQCMHYEVYFPEIFVLYGGFSLIVGNPPWDKVRFEETLFLEQFYTRYGSKLEHDKALLRKKMTPDMQRYKAGWQRSILFLSTCYKSLYPYSRGYGDDNMYRFFLELSQPYRYNGIVHNRGIASFVIPWGFFVEEGSTALRNIFFARYTPLYCIGFENRGRIFPAVDTRYKWAIFAVSFTSDQPILFHVKQSRKKSLHPHVMLEQKYGHNVSKYSRLLLYYIYYINCYIKKIYMQSIQVYKYDKKITERSKKIVSVEKKVQKWVKDALCVYACETCLQRKKLLIAFKKNIKKFFFATMQSTIQPIAQYPLFPTRVKDVVGISQSFFALPEVRKREDLVILRHIYHSFEPLQPSYCTFRRELEYAIHRDFFRITRDTEGDIPVFQGAMIWHYNCVYKEPTYYIASNIVDALQHSREVAYCIRSLYAHIPPTVQERYKNMQKKDLVHTYFGITEEAYAHCIYPERLSWRCALRCIARNTDERSVIGAFLPYGVTYQNSLCATVEKFYTYENNAVVVHPIPLERKLYVLGVFNSLVYDWMMRFSSSVNISKAALHRIPFPHVNNACFIEGSYRKLIENTLLLHCFYAPMQFDALITILEENLLKNVSSTKSTQCMDSNLKERIPQSIEEAAMVSCENDIIVANLYGLEKNDLKYILREDYFAVLYKKKRQYIDMLFSMYQ